MLGLLKDAMEKKLPETKCFLIDGYPRELEQGKRFENEVISDLYHIPILFNCISGFICENCIIM